MLDANRRGWVLELAAIGLDGANAPADFSRLASAGLGVMVRINHGYGSSGTLPLPHLYAKFAAACARYVERSRGCRIWIIGNEPNHELERPNGQTILPHQYAEAYRLCRAAIRAVPGHQLDQVLVAGPAPWNATTTYAGNEKGDWVRYFADTIRNINDKECDGFSIHTYTHNLDVAQITGDFFHTQPGYRHLRNEFRTYRDFMNTIPDRFRHLPVYITETDPTTRGRGWNPGHDVGWVQAAYREIANWNSNPHHQPILSLILYRWPQIADQPEWSISNRPGIIEDFKKALRADPAGAFRIRLPRASEPLVPVEPSTLLPNNKRWRGLVSAPLGLNLRTGQSLQHDIIQVLPFETSVTVLAEFDEWLFVSALELRGYVSRAYILRQEAAILQPVRSDYLRNQSALFELPLAPDPADRIQQPAEDSPWINHVIAAVWNQYGAFLHNLASRLNLDPAAAIAVFAIESGGQAFGRSGRMLIRFEIHIFFAEWGKLQPERFAQHFRFKPDQPWEGHEWRPNPEQPWRAFHGNQEAEWEVFNFASFMLDERAAKRSISMGAPQIMGFNHELIGYNTVQGMFDAFSAGAHSQIIGFFDYLNADPRQLAAIRKQDFRAFAAAYNGVGQADLYGALITEGVQTFNRLRAPAKLSTPSEQEPSNLPLPPTVPGQEIDAALHEAWRNHLIRGLANNDALFQRILRAFMLPYYATVVMYWSLFIIGLAACSIGFGMTIYTREAMYGVLLGGLGLASFISFFFSRPIRALEENLNFITWLGVIYNSYWARITYALSHETIQADIEDITEDFVRQLDQLMDKSAELNDRRPGVR
jgi:hypothetical protein